MVLALLIPILLARTMAMQGLVEAQSVWFVAVVPLSALIFFISADAEVARTPFDLIEAESEIVAGFHTEYSGMKFAMFFLAEFVNTLFMSALFAAIYLGGWRGFGAEQFPLLGLVYFMLKTFAVYFLFIWLRGTLPRIRVDQLLDFNWKFLVPLSLALILVVAVVDKLLQDAPDLLRFGAHLLSNLVLGFVALEILRSYARRRRAAQDAGRITPEAVAIGEAENIPFVSH
jgi:NADH-quinone oxidoreductase subunit H